MNKNFYNIDQEDMKNKIKKALKNNGIIRTFLGENFLKDNYKLEILTDEFIAEMLSQDFINKWVDLNKFAIIDEVEKFKDIV